MEFADQAGLAQATGWVSGNAGATQTDAQPANVAPAPPPEGGTTNTQGVPAGDPNLGAAPPAAPTPEDLTPYRELVDGLGGLEGARQFNELYKALASPSQDFGEIGQGIDGALQKLLGGDHYGALALALINGRYGDLLAEEFVAAHPEWLEARIAKAKPPESRTPDDDDFDHSTAQGQQQQQQMTPRERELTDRLAKLEGELKEFTRTNEQTAEQRFRAHVEKEVFGTVVDKTFAQLQGWEDSELKQVMRIAMAEFTSDQKAKETFDAASNYLRTKQPLLANQLLHAQTAFQTYLKGAMELVDLKRQAARKAAAPIEPERKEFGSTAPTEPETRQPTDRAQSNEKFWDVGELTAAVNRRLQERGVART